jgi:hypothetical protein
MPARNREEPERQYLSPSKDERAVIAADADKIGVGSDTEAHSVTAAIINYPTLLSNVPT